MTIMTATTPQELAATLAGHSDDEINQMATDVGVETVLTRMFTLMAEAFVPERAGAESAKAVWQISAPDGAHAYHVIIDDGACSSGLGPVEAPRITLGMALPDFLRFMGGEGNAMTAYMSGKLKVSGDVMFGPKMEGFFNRG
jgi:putative sterol carrier protein